MRRQLRALNGGFQRRYEALQNQGGFPGAGDPGDHAQPPLGKHRFQGMDGMQLPGGKADAPLREQLLLW